MVLRRTASVYPAVFMEYANTAGVTEYCDVDTMLPPRYGFAAVTAEKECHACGRTPEMEWRWRAAQRVLRVQVERGILW